MTHLWRSLVWGAFWMAVGLLVTSCVAGFLAGRALAQDHTGEHGVGHAEMHDIYKDWREPTAPGVSCCSNQDCRPTRAKQDAEGNWLAWDGHKWLRVPHETLLPPDLAHDGRSHLCENSGYVYCFSPAEPKS